MADPGPRAGHSAEKSVSHFRGPERPPASVAFGLEGFSNPGAPMTTRLGRNKRLRDFSCLVLITLAACSKTDKAPDDTDAAAPPTTGNNSLDSDLEKVRDFKLSMPRMQKWVQAVQNMVAVSKAHPELEGTYEADQNAPLDQQVAALEKHPQAKKAVKDAGLSPREFTMISYAYMQAAAAQSVQQMPAGKTRDSVMQSLKVHPDNVTFLQKNRAELEKLMKAMQEE